MVKEIKEGLTYVKTQTWLWGTFLAATLAYLIFWGPAEVLLPLLVKNELGGSASELGFILALGGVGAMFTAILMGNREMPRRHVTFMYAVWTLSTLAIAGYGFATRPWQAMVFCFSFNALESAGLIVWITTKQRLVPPRLMGRVSSFDWFISTALVPVSYALTGPIAKILGAQTTLIGAGILGGVVTLAFLFLPGMRDIERTHILAGVHLEGTVEAFEAAPDPTSAEPVAGATSEGASWTDLDAAAVRAPHEPGRALRAVSHAGVDDRRLDVGDGWTPVLRDPVVAESFETLANLRAAIERWRASRVAVTGELEVLELQESQLRDQLTRVRARIDALTAARDGLVEAELDVVSASAPVDAA
jgi:hypothetical protein